jgi:GrpB-like predicted nucleotidyltransferase (UPF0157 family)
VDRAQREAYLDQVLIGGRERREIVIAEYDPAWPERFAVEASRLRHALGARALRIEHIGSTSVPGLAAKPIIDVLVAVENLDDESTLRPPLEAAGYVLRVREPGHLMFRTPARDVHIHLWRESDPEVGRHLRFRDRLRASAADRAAYEQLKRRLAAREWGDVNEYADAKTGLIGEIIGRAERAGGGRGH